MKRRTVCNRDCPDACGLIATVDDDRLVRIEGDSNHPITRGVVCARTRRFVRRQYDPNRLTAPLVRTSKGWRQVSWDEALGHVADQLLRIRRDVGPEAILHYRSGGSLGALGKVIDAFFSMLGPVTVTHGSACSGAGKAAQKRDFGTAVHHDPTDLERARNVVLWGKNPLVSNLHAAPFVQRARKRGGRVVLIDPVWHASSRMADHVIQPRPGYDFELAVAVAAHLMNAGRIDPTLHEYADHHAEYLSMLRSRSVEAWARAADVSHEEVELLADVVTDRPCAFLLGWGMARRGRGAAIVRAIDALCAASGNVGIEGGGASYCTAKHGAIADIEGLAPAPRSIPEPALGRALAETKDPRIRAVWITSGNPVVMLPDSRSIEAGLRACELVVVVDSFMTDTAACASVFLPTTTLFEDDDLLASYGHMWIGASRPVLRAPKGVLTDLQIVQRLAEVLDARDADGLPPLAPRMAGTARAWKEKLAAPMIAAGVDMDRLEREVVRNPFAPSIPFADRKFPTSTGRMSLVCDAAEPPEDDSEYPTWLLSGSVRDAQGSQWSVDPPFVLPVTCHPDTAPGFADGDEVMLRNALGEVRGKLRFDTRQRRDVVVVPKGGWLSRGVCVNVLVSPKLTDLGCGAAYLDARVRIEPLTDDPGDRERCPGR